MLRTSQVSLNSNPETDFRYSAIYGTIGVFKGRIFAIKMVNKKSIDMTRPMKKELKWVCEIFMTAYTSHVTICNRISLSQYELRLLSIYACGWHQFRFLLIFPYIRDEKNVSSYPHLLCSRVFVFACDVCLLQFN